MRSIFRSAKRKGGFRPPFLSLIFLGALPLSLLMAVSLPASAQEGGKGQERPVNGGVYRRPLENDPETLDPARISDIYSRSVAQQIFDGLVQFDHTLAISPALAQFWKASRDGLTWTFTLRKGVKFHHGREVTADDVVYSLTRILDPKTKSGAADLFINIKGAREFKEGRAKSVAGLVALDRHTVQVTLDEAPVPFVSLLAVGHAKIVPKDVVEREGDAFGTHPIGTGPFKFVRWERGREIVLTANQAYFQGAPHLSQIMYRIFPGTKPKAIYEEFQRGNLEDTPIPSHSYRRILAEKSHIYIKRPMFSVRFYGINTRVKPLDDRRIRQALIYAINREALVEEIFLGRYPLARGILPPGTPGFNPKLKGYPYNSGRARALLAEAGYPGGRDLQPIPIMSNRLDEDFFRLHDGIKKYLEAVGIRADFRYVTDWPTFSKLLDERKFQVFLYTWYADVPDPDNFLFKLFYSRGSRNFFGYSNPVVDDLLLRARREPDPQRRIQLYRRAEQLILDDAPIIPIFHYTYERLFQPYVRSIEVNGLGDPYIPLRKIWLDTRR